MELFDYEIVYNVTDHVTDHMIDLVTYQAIFQD